MNTCLILVHVLGNKKYRWKADNLPKQIRVHAFLKEYSMKVVEDCVSQPNTDKTHDSGGGSWGQL